MFHFNLFKTTIHLCTHLHMCVEAFVHMYLLLGMGSLRAENIYFVIVFPRPGTYNSKDLLDI